MAMVGTSSGYQKEMSTREARTVGVDVVTADSDVVAERWVDCPKCWMPDSNVP